jgi:hypothetical protein
MAVIATEKRRKTTATISSFTHSCTPIGEMDGGVIRRLRMQLCCVCYIATLGLPLEPGGCGAGGEPRWERRKLQNDRKATLTSARARYAHDPGMLLGSLECE